MCEEQVRFSHLNCISVVIKLKRSDFKIPAEVTVRDYMIFLR